jgi:hypothetical protein
VGNEQTEHGQKEAAGREINIRVEGKATLPDFQSYIKTESEAIHIQSGRLFKDITTERR